MQINLRIQILFSLLTTRSTFTFTHPKEHFHIVDQSLHLQLRDRAVVIHIKDSEDLL